MPLDSPALAEKAFYLAFEQGDVEGMMTVWAPAGDVICIHPMGPALTNLDLIRTSWLEIFAAPFERKIVPEVICETAGNQVVTRSVLEHFSIPARDESFAPVFATNTFRQGDSGWFITGHHASPGRVAEIIDATSMPTQH